jgi:hypothetical protein
MEDITAPRTLSEEERQFLKQQDQRILVAGEYWGKKEYSDSVWQFFNTIKERTGIGRHVDTPQIKGGVGDMTSNTCSLLYGIKKFGPYSFTEMTDWHNALVGAAGILSCLLITFVTYWLPGDFWSVIGKMATFYAFFNMIPFSKLDGSQIYFGSRVLWSVLAVITLIFMTYAMLLI